jgi:DNA-directed RNA polymerase sigma subunit (sigma70/sigma32)
MIDENKKKKIVQQRIAYQKSLSEVARMFGTSRIQIRKIETEYLNQLKESKNV